MNIAKKFIKTKNRRKELFKMENKDILVNGNGDNNSVYKDKPTKDERERTTNGKRKILIFRVAVFLSVANLTLIAMKYVHPIVNNATATFINLSIVLILICGCVVVSILKT